MIDLRKTIFICALYNKKDYQGFTIIQEDSENVQIEALSLGIVVAPQEGDRAGTLNLFVKSFHGYTEKVILSRFFKHISERFIKHFDLCFLDASHAHSISIRSIALGVRKDSRFFNEEHLKGEIKLVQQSVLAPVASFDYYMSDYRALVNEDPNNEVSSDVAPKLKLKPSESAVVDMVRIVQASVYSPLISDDHVIYTTDYDS